MVVIIITITIKTFVGIIVVVVVVLGLSLLFPLRLPVLLVEILLLPTGLGRAGSFQTRSIPCGP